MGRILMELMMRSPLLIMLGWTSPKSLQWNSGCIAMPKVVHRSQRGMEPIKFDTPAMIWARLVLPIQNFVPPSEPVVPGVLMYPMLNIAIHPPPNGIIGWPPSARQVVPCSRTTSMMAPSLAGPSSPGKTWMSPEGCFRPRRETTRTPTTK